MNGPDRGDNRLLILSYNQGPPGHHLRSTPKRDRSILCIAQNSVIPFFRRKRHAARAMDFCISRLIHPTFEVRMRSNALAGLFCRTTNDSHSLHYLKCTLNLYFETVVGSK